MAIAYIDAVTSFIQGIFWMGVWSMIFAVILSVVFWFIPKY